MAIADTDALTGKYYIDTKTKRSGAIVARVRDGIYLVGDPADTKVVFDIASIEMMMTWRIYVVESEWKKALAEGAS